MTSLVMQINHWLMLVGFCRGLHNSPVHKTAKKKKFQWTLIDYPLSEGIHFLWESPSEYHLMHPVSILIAMLFFIPGSDIVVGAV